MSVKGLGSDRAAAWILSINCTIICCTVRHPANCLHKHFNKSIKWNSKDAKNEGKPWSLSCVCCSIKDELKRKKHLPQGYCGSADLIQRLRPLLLCNLLLLNESCLLYKAPLCSLFKQRIICVLWCSASRQKDGRRQKLKQESGGWKDRRRGRN